MLWRSRLYLPHFEVDSTPQMVTFHLADSFPTELLVRWKDELSFLSKSEADRERGKRIEAYLDLGHG